MNKKIYIGVYGIILNEGKILLIKKARGPYKGMYDLPGGVWNMASHLKKH